MFLFHILLPPRPDPVMWTKDGGELPDLDRMIVEGRELTFTSLNKTDNGTYRCEATNHLGTSSAEYVLYVYGEFTGKADMRVIMFQKVKEQGELFILRRRSGCSNPTLKVVENMKGTCTSTNNSIAKSRIIIRPDLHPISALRVISGAISHRENMGLR